MRIVLWLALAACAAAGLLLIACNWWVVGSTQSRVVDAPDQLPGNAVGLVLGTSPRAPGGSDNAHFAGRMDAAAALFASGKVKHLLLSGANPSTRYNEPKAMAAALKQRGVPADAITLDFAGFRTLDSLVRARAVFELGQLTIITQRYHGYRAVFIAQRQGIDATAFAAPTNPAVVQSRRTEVREVFARVKAVLDLFLTRKQPKFLGEAEPIKIDESRS